MSTSIVPEIRALQHTANVCAFCERPLKRKPGPGRPAFVCHSADCRSEEESARSRRRTARRHEALAALAGVVRAIGWSTSTLARMVNP